MEHRALKAILASSLAAAVLTVPSCRRPEKAPPAPVAALVPDPAAEREAREAQLEAMTPADFLGQVSASNKLQVQLGTLAIEKAEDPTVKDLGKRMATNHTAIEVLVASLGNSEQLELVATPDPAAAALFASLSALSGTAFDKAYTTSLDPSQKDALEMFRWESDHGTNDAIKAFATQTAPIIATQQRISEKLYLEVNKEEIKAAEDAKIAAAKAAAEAAAQQSQKKRGKRAPQGTAG